LQPIQESRLGDVGNDPDALSVTAYQSRNAYGAMIEPVLHRNPEKLTLA
jgi:hypothetical protein